jgi:hypothetical protein
LGFKDHDIPVLIKARLLLPLGRPAPNAVKYFAASQVEELAANPEWLAKATQTVSGYWDRQNKKRKSREAYKTVPSAEEVAA